MNRTRYANLENSFIEDVNSESTAEDVTGNNIILSIMWKGNMLMASFYNISEKMLYTIMEVLDKPPIYQVCASLIRQTNPKHLIVFGKLADHFVQSVIGFVRQERPDYYGADLQDFYATLPANMTLLDYKDFTFNACLYRVRKVVLQSEPVENQSTDKLNYVQTLINIDCQHTVHTLGALLKFLEQAWHNMRSSMDDLLIYLHLKQVMLDDHVYIDATTFNSLNVFNQMNHDSTFKHGGSTSCREGSSLFKLLSQHCVSTLGLTYLRDMLASPLKNLDELTKRYEFMDFVNDPRNGPVTAAIRNGLRKVVNVNKIINKLRLSQGNNGHWRAIFNAIYAVLQANEELKPFLGHCKLFRDYHNSITENLYNLEATITSTMDLKAGIGRERPWVREQIDAELDEARNKHQAIKSRLVAAARIVVNQLPPQLGQCSVSYVPDIGHILSVQKWAPNCSAADLQPYGCYYMFDTDDFYYFKNALCQELDNQLGDLPAEIENHSNRIIQRVAMFVVNENAALMNPLEQLAYMDALMSMAKVGQQLNYVRPMFNMNNMLEIKDGRHPLAELNNDNYVPNHYTSGGVHRRMKIVTGPNASGKSMYLKQTAILVYMAHVGSYIPAAAANISLVHSMHSRLHLTESTAWNISAFTTDLIQMGNALYNAQSSSLVIMDEFGRGTSGNVPKGLLLGALNKFLERDLCPHVILSTHLTLEKKFLDSPLVHYQMMTHMREETTGNIMLLYKIQDGESSSYTFEICSAILEPSIVERAKEIYAFLNGDKTNFESPEEETAFYANVNVPPFDD